jgi:hypothetical protein
MAAFEVIYVVAATLWICVVVAALCIGYRVMAKFRHKKRRIEALQLWPGNQHEVWVAARCLRVQWKRIRRVELVGFRNPHPARLTCLTSRL